jgi:hypothetical protein
VLVIHHDLALSPNHRREAGMPQRLHTFHKHPPVRQALDFIRVSG